MLQLKEEEEGGGSQSSNAHISFHRLDTGTTKREKNINSFSMEMKFSS